MLQIDHIGSKVVMWVCFDRVCNDVIHVDDSREESRSHNDDGHSYVLLDTNNISQHCVTLSVYVFSKTDLVSIRKGCLSECEICVCYLVEVVVHHPHQLLLDMLVLKLVILRYILKYTL